MSQALKKSILLLPLMLVVGSYPATAQITATPVSLPERPSGVNSVAFDSVNQVYLVTLAGAGAVNAKFVSKTGAQIGNVFPITVPNEAPYTGWVGVSFGGTATDPAFLVTYVATTGVRCVASKYGRLVRYRAGQALVGGANFITNVGCEWPSAEKAQAAWTGAQFVVGTRVASVAFPQPELRTVDLGGGVSGPVIIGDYLDYYGSPAIACASDGVCLVSGYANGIPFGGKGGTYARLINGSTLQPLTDMFYLDDHSSRMENQYVVFNSQTGQFLAAWWRAGFVDTRVVTHEGALLPLRQSVFGGGAAGDLALSYNAGTGKTILISKYVPADLYAVELDANGALANPNNLVLITRWDGIWPEYTPAIASNGADGQSLAIAVLNSGGRAAIIQGQGGTTPPPPPEPPPPPPPPSPVLAATAAKADFSVDGKADIVWQRDDGYLSVWAMSGTTAMSAQMVNPGSVDPNWRIAATADINGDGKADFVWQHRDGGLAVWYMSGANLAGSELLNPAQVQDPNWKIVGTGDFNGDGRADLVWQHRDGWLAVWYMIGANLAGSTLLSPVQQPDLNWKIVGVGDFNGDFKPDLVWQHTDGWLAVWYMSGVNLAGSALLNPAQVADPNWRIRAVIDLNGDGQTDLIWQHMSAGSLSAWLMNGNSVANAVSLNPSSVSGGWKVMGPR